MKRINCQCCGRQIVRRQVNDECCVGGQPPTVMVGGFCCHVCAQDLDEYGLFPEERASAEMLRDTD